MESAAVETTPISHDSGNKLVIPSIPLDLPNATAVQLKNFLLNFCDVFYQRASYCGRTDLIRHVIHTTGPLFQQEKINKKCSAKKGTRKSSNGCWMVISGLT